jgi:predicted permease
LVAAQTALALVLLASALLVLSSLERLQRVDPGFRSENVTAARIALDAGRYRDDPSRARFFDALLERLRARPEVEAAGAVSLLPLRDGTTDWAVSVTGSSVAPPDEWQFEQSRFASEGYFETVGVPILLGRGFAATDDAEAAAPVAIVSASFAARYWPDRSPLGHSVLVGGPGSEQPPRVVIGVVGDVKHERLDESPLPTYYLPMHQDPEAMTVVLRARGGQDLSPTLGRELAALDPEQALDGARPLREVVAAASGATRFQVRVLGSFALLALVLAAVGTYGVVAYLVEQERRDFGIRLALGARRSEVTAAVLRRAGAHAAAGLAAGLALSLAGAGLLRRFLYEVSPSEPTVLAAAAGALLAAVLVAAWLPARRAGRVDPIVTLRAE